MALLEQGGSTGPKITITAMENGQPASGENQARLAVDRQVRRLRVALGLQETEQPQPVISTQVAGPQS